MLSHLPEILDALPILVIEIDEDDRVVYVNAAAKALLCGEQPCELQPPPEISKFFASQEILGMIGVYEAAGTCLQNTNVLFVDAHGNPLSHVVTAKRVRTADGCSRAVLVAQRNTQLQEELAESSRWAAAEQNRADDLSRTRDALQKSHDRLREMQAQLVQASRLAGMAEIASGAIHNIGNVLNGVNVGVKLARDKVSSSRVNKLGRLCDALNQQLSLPEAERDSKRIAGFLAYFDDLNKALDTEKASLLGDLDHVLGKIEHIKNVVGSQQSYARSGGVCESVKLADVVEQALALQRTQQTERIEIVQDLAGVDTVELDRHNLLQILVNLVANAENSMIENDTPEKRISIVATLLGDGQFELRVQDTGIGVDKALQERIFAHGFTTRSNGSGFGLHNAALLAKKMRGRMGVVSEGAGKGATFWLRLPIESQKLAA